jgi:hypothetical protein
MPSIIPSDHLGYVLRQHDLAVELDGDMSTMLVRIRHGLGPTRPEEMEAALKQFSEKTRRIIAALSPCQQLLNLAAGSSRLHQSYQASSPDLQAGCSARLQPDEPVE